MIALKTSDVWEKLSVFGRPWAPFDFGSGMGCRDVERTECVKLGLIQPKEKLNASQIKFNDNIKLPTPNGDSELIKKAQLSGDIGKFENGEISPRPNAYPVSDALDIRIRDEELRPAVEEAIRLINTVHGDGNLPVIPIEMNNKMSELGHFSYRQYSDSRICIDMKIAIKKTQNSKLTVIHEIGHFLDLQGLNTNDNASTNGKITEVMDAIFNSDEYKILQKNFKENPTKYNEYWKKDNECFARAYAQFIATESGDESLMSELKEAQTRGKSQWSDSSFEPIRSAMKKLFIEKGWM